MTRQTASRIVYENAPRESRIHLVKRVETTQPRQAVESILPQRAAGRRMAHSPLTAVFTAALASVPLIWLGKALLAHLHLP